MKIKVIDVIKRLEEGISGLEHFIEKGGIEHFFQSNYNLIAYCDGEENYDETLYNYNDNDIIEGEFKINKEEQIICNMVNNRLTPDEYSIIDEYLNNDIDHLKLDQNFNQIKRYKKIINKLKNFIDSDNQGII